ncbi:MAG: T9SS type A sorting domain-containing protein, partial [Ignavibacteriae bacterium]|nr:T9SS type A sorting domain-containing protein [Ignavibacteriota bacterium]
MNDGTVVCTYSGRIVNNQFTASSGCFTFNPTTQQWTDVSHPDMYYWCKDVVVDTNGYYPEAWFVCVFNGWGGSANGKGGIYYTTDRGASWEKIVSDISVTSVGPPPQILSIFQKKNTSDIQFQDFFGIICFTTEMNGYCAVRTNNNYLQDLTYYFRQPERIFMNQFDRSYYWITNFGCGMIMQKFPTSVGDELKNSNNSIIIYPNPASDLVKISLKNIEETKLQLKIYDVLGNEIKIVECGYYEKEKPITIDTKQFHEGVYYVRVKTMNGIYTRN